MIKIKMIDGLPEINPLTINDAIQITYINNECIVYQIGDKLPEPSDEEKQAIAMANMQAEFTNAIQEYLDGFARTKNYDGIMSATTYATSSVARFKSEGQYAVKARDTTWAKAYDILDKVITGERSMPTLQEVVSELPKLEWPVV